METGLGVDGGVSCEARLADGKQEKVHLHVGHEEDVQFPLKTHSEVDGGVLMVEAQPKALSQKHKVEAPNEEVHLPLETHSEVDGGMQAPPAEVHVVLEVPSEVEEDCPTVLECTMFRGRERTINIP